MPENKLDIRLNDLPLTRSPLVVRFPVGHEPHGIEWIMFHRQQPQARQNHSEDLHVLAEAERKNPSAMQRCRTKMARQKRYRSCQRSMVLANTLMSQCTGVLTR